MYSPDNKSVFWDGQDVIAYLVEFGFGKYLIVPFCYASAAYQAHLIGLATGIFAQLCLAKILTMARPNSPDMRRRRVRLGLISIASFLSEQIELAFWPKWEPLCLIIIIFNYIQLYSFTLPCLTVDSKFSFCYSQEANAQCGALILYF